MTYVQMNRSDVRRLAIIVPPLSRRHNDLAALQSAAKRAHVQYTLTKGPTVTAAAGRTASADGVDVTPLSIRRGKAFVRIRETQTVVRNGPDLTRIVAASYLYHSGENRRLAGQAVRAGNYRYVFATVTIR